MELYINPEIAARNLDDADRDEIEFIYERFSDEGVPNDDVEAFRGFIQIMASVAKQNIDQTSVAAFTLGTLYDEDGYAAYTDVSTMAYGIATNRDGLTVFFTALGKITLL